MKKYACFRTSYMEDLICQWRKEKKHLLLRAELRYRPTHHIYIYMYTAFNFICSEAFPDQVDI